MRCGLRILLWMMAMGAVGPVMAWDPVYADLGVGYGRKEWVLPMTYQSHSQSSMAGQFVVGYQLTPRFSTEGAFILLPRYRYRYADNGGYVVNEGRSNAIALLLRVNAVTGHGVQFYAKGGFAASELSIRVFQQQGAAILERQAHSGRVWLPVFAIGSNWAVGKHWRVGVEGLLTAQRNRVKDLYASRAFYADAADGDISNHALGRYRPTNYVVMLTVGYDG